MYKWNILSQSQSIKEILNSILNWKNISKDKVQEFIYFNFEPHSPFTLTNMDKAVERIKKAIDNKEKICIIGDYDADGVTGTAVMYIGLRSLFADVIWQLPDRFIDGYGLNQRMIDVAKDESCQLIITVDNGIAAKDKIDYAKSIGLDVVVTDHHQFTGEMPTEITVNPQIDDAYPFKCICGCMVAFKVIMALMPDYQERFPDLYEELVSITAIGTVADVMDLMDENRYFVKKGLQYLVEPKNVGLNALMEEMGLLGKQVKADDIGFLIAPCINAAGRLENPATALNLLLCEDYAHAKTMAKHLVKLNEERKRLQKRVVDSLDVDENQRVIVAHLDGVGHGILGIIAGKITERYQKPCFVLGGNDEEGLSGSGRSIYGFDINGIVQANKDIVSGGGHAAACGVSMDFDKLEQFKDRCNQYFDEWSSTISPEDIVEGIDIVSEIPFDVVNERLHSNIDKLQPFGNGNEEPVFVTKGVTVESYRIVGKNQNVVQMTLTHNGITLKAVGFEDVKNEFEKIDHCDIIDVVYSISLNEWPKGKFTIQLNIKDLKKG